MVSSRRISRGPERHNDRSRTELWLRVGCALVQRQLAAVRSMLRPRTSAPVLPFANREEAT